MLMLILIYCERKILLFYLNGTTDKFNQTGRTTHPDRQGQQLIQTDDMGLISAVVCVRRYRYDKQAGRPGSLDFRPRKRPASVHQLFFAKQSIFALINRFVQFFFPLLFPGDITSVSIKDFITYWTQPNR